jgi:ATP-dependent DNA helicase RecQ
MKREGGVILATVALGLGVYFPDVERVIHYGCPQTLEQFYQESGRGGRSGQKSISVLYFNGHDVSEERNA